MRTPTTDTAFHTVQSAITHILVEIVTVSPTSLQIDMKADGMRDLVQSVLNDSEWKKAA